MDGWRLARRLAAVFVTASVVLLAARDASAYCRTTTCDVSSGDTCEKNDAGCVRDGVVLSWTTMPIVYRFAQPSAKIDADKSRTAIRNAFQAWETVQCPNGGRTSLRFRENQEISSTIPSDNKPASQNFAIFFRDDEWPHNDSEESLALTNQVYGKVTGTIDFADIEINTSQEQFSVDDDDPGIDLQAVLTHEVGHYIGLAHSLEDNSIMAPRYCQDQDRCGDDVAKKRALSDDDVTAVCTLYKPSGAEPANSPASGPAALTQPGGCAASSSSSEGSSMLSIGVFSFLAIAIGRRRSRRRGLPKD